MPGQRILLLGSGPTMPGQSREYNSIIVNACKTLNSCGHSVILYDSNISSPLIGNGMCKKAYIEPMTREVFEKILHKERPHCVFATISGKNTFNFALLIHQLLSFFNLNFTFLGTSGNMLASTQKPDIFKTIVESTGEKSPDVILVNQQDKAIEIGKSMGFPVIVRAIPEPVGVGVSIAYNTEELEKAVSVALAISPIKQVAVEKSLAGEKSTEWVVLRDRKDEVKVIGGVEYMEPIGVHSHDSVVVSPVQSLSEAARLKSQKIAEKIIHAFKITGCSTIKLSHSRDDESEISVVNVTPRISRAAILCGKQIGALISEWHTRLCVNESINDLQLSESADDNLFETKKEDKKCWCCIPIFPGNRLMNKEETLTTFTKSVDSATGVGENFISALQKATRACLQLEFNESGRFEIDKLLQLVSKPVADRLWYIYHALKIGVEKETLIKAAGIDKWFIEQISTLVDFEYKCSKIQDIDLISKSAKIKKIFKEAKQLGYSNTKLAALTGIQEKSITKYFSENKIFPMSVELPVGNTAIINYSSKKSKAGSKNSILIISSQNPNSIKRADSEYTLSEVTKELTKSDFKCVCCSSETIHLADNNNIKRYIQPLDCETLNAIIDIEKPTGILLQFGDYFSYKLIDGMEDIIKIPVLGTSYAAAQRLFKRERFFPMMQKLDIRLPAHGIATNAQNALVLANDLGYPVIVHPAIPEKLPQVDIWFNEQEAKSFLNSAESVKELYPISIEKFLEGAREFHIEGVCDKNSLFIGGIIEHIEKAGVNTNDSAAVWSPSSSAPSFIDEGRDIIKRLALELGIQGLIGIKLAFLDNKLYLLDVCPGASRNTAFINKITGEKLIPSAVQVALGKSIQEIGAKEPIGDYVAVRAPVFPFASFPDSDASLGPESCSVGAAVGLSYSFGTAYAKALVSVGNHLPTNGAALLSVADKDKQEIIPIARELFSLGFVILATSGTYSLLRKNDIPAKLILKYQEGRPNVIDGIIDGDIKLIINTPGTKANRFAEAKMRHEAVARGILVITTIPAANAAIEGITAYMRNGFDVKSFEEFVQGLRYQHTLEFDAQPSLEFDL